jgi:hypothetical protein
MQGGDCWQQPVLYAIWIVIEDNVEGGKHRRETLLPVSLSLLGSHSDGLCTWKDIINNQGVGGHAWAKNTMGELYGRFFGSPLLSVQDAIVLSRRTNEGPYARFTAKHYLGDSTVIPRMYSPI